eukprot:6182365-Pleurochrysis_carterae.AAC.2
MRSHSLGSTSNQGSGRGADHAQGRPLSLCEALYMGVQVCPPSCLPITSLTRVYGLCRSARATRLEETSYFVFTIDCERKCEM